jgi:hypothetical protein
MIFIDHYFHPHQISKNTKNIFQKKFTPKQMEHTSLLVHYFNLDIEQGVKKKNHDVIALVKLVVVFLCVSSVPLLLVLLPLFTCSTISK